MNNKKILILAGASVALATLLSSGSIKEPERKKPDLESRLQTTIPPKKRLFIPGGDLATLYGVARADQGNISEAEKAFKAGIRLYPSTSSNYEGLGLLLINQERYHEAESVFKKLIERDDQSHIGNLGLCKVYFNKDDLSRIDSHLKRAQTIVDNHTQNNSYAQKKLAKSHFSIVSICYYLVDQFHSQFRETGNQEDRYQREKYFKVLVEELDKTLKLDPKHAKAQELRKKITPLRAK